MDAQVLFRALAALEAAKDGADAPLNGRTYTTVLSAWSELKYELSKLKIEVPISSK